MKSYWAYAAYKSLGATGQISCIVDFLSEHYLTTMTFKPSKPSKPLLLQGGARSWSLSQRSLDERLNLTHCTVLHCILYCAYLNFFQQINRNWEKNVIFKIVSCRAVVTSPALRGTFLQISAPTLIRPQPVHLLIIYLLQTSLKEVC